MRVGYVNQGGIKTGLDGSVTYDFDAHIHARGLDLDAATDFPGPPTDRQVRWLSSDGGLVANLVGYLDGNDENHLWTAADGPTWTSGLDLFAGGPLGGASRMDLIVGAQVATLLDGDGFSSFLRFVTGDSGTVGGGVNPWGASPPEFTLPTPVEWLLIAMNVSGYSPAPGVVSWRLLLDGAPMADNGFPFNLANVHHNIGWCIALVGPVAAGVHQLSADNPSSPLTIDGSDNCAWFVAG